MCFLNKLLLLAVLGWLFQVGRVRVQLRGGVGGWRQGGERLSLIKVGARRGRFNCSVGIVSKEDCLNPGTVS